jgi:CheY-like chemotaxis protein
LGHEVWDLTAGESVTDVAEQVRPHLVILDIALPGIDGVEVARRLAKLPRRRGMKVVALSGFVQQPIDPDLFDAHLLKGGGTGELMQLLN